MKKLLLILLLLVSAKLPAQIIGRAHGGSGPWLSADTLKFFQSKGTLKPAWTTLSATSFLPDSSGNTAKYLQVLAGGGFGWATPTGGSPYFKDDGGTPVQDPLVTSGKKAYSIGDSVTTTGYGSISWGGRLVNSGVRSVLIAPDAGFLSTQTGNLTVNIGGGNLSGGVGSLVLGNNNEDFVTSNVDDGTHGYNIILGGYTQNNHATDNLNFAAGYNVQVYGTGNLALLGSTASGTASDYNVSLGWNSFISGASGKKYQVNIGPHNGNYPTGNFDSIMIFSNQPNTKVNNTDEIVFGGGNINSSTDWAFQFGMGGKWGNPSTFDVLSGKRNGTVAFGNPGGTFLGLIPDTTGNSTKVLSVVAGGGFSWASAGGGSSTSYLTMSVPLMASGISHSEGGTGAIAYSIGGTKQSTGGTNPSNSWVRADLDAAGNDDIGGHIMRFHARCRMETEGSDFAAFIGIGKTNQNNTPFSPAERWIGIKIERAASGSVTVKGTTNNNSTETTVTLAGVTETSFFDLGIDITATSATFYINGVSKGTISTNFPANLYAWYCAGITNNGGASNSAFTVIAATLELQSY